MLIQKNTSKLVSASKSAMFFVILFIAKDVFTMQEDKVNFSHKPFPMKSFKSSDSEVSSISGDGSQNSTITAFSLIKAYKKSTRMKFKPKQKSGLKVKQKPGWPY